MITGISGSGGSYLAEYIVQNHPEVEVHGLSRWHSTTTSDNLRAIRERVTVHECDLADLGSVIDALQKIKPDAIFNLASHANVRASFITPNAVLSNNILGTSNLFEAVRLLKLDPLIQHCSTSEVYGQVDPKFVPINEDAPIDPASPYAVSKVAQDLLARVYFVSYEMRIVRTRMFTYLNPAALTCLPRPLPARSPGSSAACKRNWSMATSIRCAPLLMCATRCGRIGWPPLRAVQGKSITSAARLR